MRAGTSYINLSHGYVPRSQQGARHKEEGYLQQVTQMSAFPNTDYGSSSLSHETAPRIKTVYMLPHQLTEDCCSQAAGVVHSFNPSQHLGGRGRMISPSLKIAWSTELVPGRPRSYKEILSPKNKKQKRNCCTWQDCQLH